MVSRLLRMYLSPPTLHSVLNFLWCQWEEKSSIRINSTYCLALAQRITVPADAKHAQYKRHVVETIAVRIPVERFKLSSMAESLPTLSFSVTFVVTDGSSQPLHRHALIMNRMWSKCQ